MFNSHSFGESWHVDSRVTGYPISIVQRMTIGICRVMHERCYMVTLNPTHTTLKHMWANLLACVPTYLAHNKLPSPPFQPKPQNYIYIPKTNKHCRIDISSIIMTTLTASRIGYLWRGHTCTQTTNLPLKMQYPLDILHNFKVSPYHPMISLPHIDSPCTSLKSNTLLKQPLFIAYPKHTHLKTST